MTKNNSVVKHYYEKFYKLLICGDSLKFITFKMIKKAAARAAFLLPSMALFFIFVRLKDVYAVSLEEKNAERSRHTSMIMSFAVINAPVWNIEKGMVVKWVWIVKEEKGCAEKSQKTQKSIAWVFRRRLCTHFHFLIELMIHYLGTSTIPVAVIHDCVSPYFYDPKVNFLIL